MLLRLLILLILAGALVAGGYWLVEELYIKPEQRLLADKKLPPPQPPEDPSIAEFERCMELRKNVTPSEARAAFERFIKEFPETRKKSAALDAIGEINSAEFFAAKPTEANVYVVTAGDSLSRIAARRRVPVELILRLNKMENETLQIAQRVIAPSSDFRVVLQQRPRLVVLYNGQKFFRQYPAVTWPGMNKNPVIYLPKANGKLLEKAALNKDGVVKPTDKEYFDASHILTFSIPGHSLYTQMDDSGGTIFRPPGGGIGLAPANMSEIAILLPRGTPVTLD